MECDKNDTHGTELTAGTVVEPQDACAHTESGALNTFVVWSREIDANSLATRMLS